MNDRIKITYTYPTIVRQIMYLTILFYVLLHCGVTTELLLYKVEGYYEDIIVIPTYLIYFLVIAAVVTLFFGHKLWYSEFDYETLIFHNRLLHREKVLDLTQVKFAVFDKYGVKFYDKTNVDSDKDQPIFKLPFYRLGFIYSTELDLLYQMLRQRGDVGLVKTYKVLLGYSNPWKLLILPYGIFTYAFLMNCITPVTAFIVLWQNHGIIG